MAGEAHFCTGGINRREEVVDALAEPSTPEASALSADKCEKRRRLAACIWHQANAHVLSVIFFLSDLSASV